MMTEEDYRREIAREIAALGPDVLRRAEARRAEIREDVRRESANATDDEVSAEVDRRFGNGADWELWVLEQMQMARENGASDEDLERARHLMIAQGFY